MLEVRNVCKKYGENQVLLNCDLSIKKQEIVALMGENGSGKSTLFNIITGVKKADSGKIYLHGEDLGSKAVYTRAGRGIYRSFQSSELFENISVLDHLLMVYDNSDTNFFQNLFFYKKQNRKVINRVEEVLHELEIERIRHLLISEISYGQRKLVNIGMSLLTGQKILLLDEIFAGINMKLIEKIKNILLKIKQEDEKSMLLITHDFKFANEIADRIVKMENGAIVS